jgi:hypothetical protein
MKFAVLVLPRRQRGRSNAHSGWITWRLGERCLEGKLYRLRCYSLILSRTSLTIISSINCIVDNELNPQCLMRYMLLYHEGQVKVLQYVWFHRNPDGQARSVVVRVFTEHTAQLWGFASDNTSKCFIKQTGSTKPCRILVHFGCQLNDSTQILPDQCL